jgi:Spy/CpxP family protein refolding chaperone
MKMNIILKSLFVISLGLLLSVGAKAQDGPQGQMSPQELLDREAKQMKKQLLLTKEQTAKLEQVNKNSITAMIELRNNQALDRQARIDKMRSMRTEREAAIKAMLTEEQSKKYEEMQQNREHNRGQQWGGRRENN